MSWTETPLAIQCGPDRLHGIVSRPEAGRPRARTGVVIVVGGPQYRAGSHRQFVHLARALAARGHVALRFDVRGMGDSDGEPQGFEHQSPDLQAALDALLQAEPELADVVLFGLCDGASAALLYLDRPVDPRVAGLVLLNPWVRSETTHASTQVKHYYTARLRDPAFWRKLLSGGVALGAVGELLRTLRTWWAGPAGGAGDAAASFQERMARAWRGFDGPILLLLSGEDYTAREFEEAVRTQPCWQGALQRAALTLQRLEGADHTLSPPGAKDQAADVIGRWLQAAPKAAR